MNKTSTLTVAAFVLTAAFLSLFAGCGGEEPESLRESEGADYARIICMSPASAELVFAIGQGERVVGVSDFTTYPPEADDLPRCGGFFNPNFELILALDPDIIITQGEAAELNRFGERYGVSILSLDITGLDSIYEAIALLGRRLGSEKEVGELVGEMKAGMQEIADRAGDRAQVRTLLVTGRDPGSLREVHVVGGGGFLHDLLTAAGGENILSDAGREYLTVSKEIILARGPEVIIELQGEGMMGERERERYLSVWNQMPALPAVRDGRVYVIGEGFALVPGPRVVKTAERIARLLHGEDPNGQ